MEEELQPTEMKEMQVMLGPEKEILKRKDKTTERKNAKKMKLDKVDGWGETPVTETRNYIRQWLLESSHEEQDGQEWPEVSNQGAIKKMNKEKAFIQTDEIAENDIGPEGRTVLSNGSEQGVSIVMRKALIQTDEIAKNDIGPDGWSGP